MFLREARISALLHHGHIARVLDFAHTADEPGNAAGIIEKSPQNKGNLFPGVACRFWLFRGVWEKLWELCSVR